MLRAIFFVIYLFCSQTVVFGMDPGRITPLPASRQLQNRQMRPFGVLRNRFATDSDDESLLTDIEQESQCALLNESGADASGGEEDSFDPWVTEEQKRATYGMRLAKYFSMHGGDSYDEALSLLASLANKAEIHSYAFKARNELAILLLRGDGTHSEYEAARLNFEAVASHDGADCQERARANFYLGTIYQDGLGVPVNDDSAIKFLRKAYASDCPDIVVRSARLLGALYHAKSEYERAHFYFNRVVGLHSKANVYDKMESLLFLSEMHLNGNGTDIDYGEVERYATSVVKAEGALPEQKAEAQLHLADIYAEGSPDLEKNREKAKECLSAVINNDKAHFYVKLQAVNSLIDFYQEEGGTDSEKQIFSLLKQAEKIDGLERGLKKRVRMALPFARIVDRGVAEGELDLSSRLKALDCTSDSKDRAYYKLVLTNYLIHGLGGAEQDLVKAKELLQSIKAEIVDRDNDITNQVKAYLDEIKVIERQRHLRNSPEESDKESNGGLKKRARR